MLFLLEAYHIPFVKGRLVQKHNFVCRVRSTESETELDISAIWYTEYVSEWKSVLRQGTEMPVCTRGRMLKELLLNESSFVASGC